MYWPDEPEGFEQELLERALPNSRYLFFKRGRGFGSMESLLSGVKDTVYYGFCTHCGKESILPQRPKHNDKFTCPSCGSVCTAKEDGRSAKHLYDDGGYNLIQREGESFYISHYYVALDYREDKHLPKLIYEPCSRRWEITEGAIASYNDQPHFDHEKNKWIYEWEPMKTIGSEKFCDEYTKITPEMLAGCRLENSRLFEYMSKTAKRGINDIIKYLAVYQKHPNIANLVDGRYLAFVHEYVYGSKALINRIINWKKARPHEMLRVQKEELPVFCDIAKRSMEAALVYQKLRLKGHRLTNGQISVLKNIGRYELDERPMQEAIKRGRIIRALNYMYRQITAGYPNEDINASNAYNTIILWRDYLKECEKLKYDLFDDSIYYPPDLMKAHERTMKLIRIKEDKAAREKAMARTKQLEWMAYAEEDLLIRPAESVNELKDEGKELHHCVATYAGSHLSGKTAIFFIRRVSEPEKSWFTLELDEKHFKVRQNRGMKNCAPPDEVNQFVERWLKWLPKEKARLKRQKKEKAA